MFKIKKVDAHCDIPCAVYDPAVAQFAALSVVRFLDLIGEMDDSLSSKEDIAHLSRIMEQKESHAKEVKDAVATIWGDYFKEPHMDAWRAALSDVKFLERSLRAHEVKETRDV